MTIAAAHARPVRRGRSGRPRVARVGGDRRATEWLNSPRLTPSSLAGKVVLVDFCTYTCINWLRTLPYIRAWAQKYRQGLVVIGVHTPEFAFETERRQRPSCGAADEDRYPVVIDNDYSIWRAFKNQYWPALYFVDRAGRVRQHHFGEGEYEQSEKVIQRLLAEAGAGGLRDGVVSVDADGVEAPADWDNLKSPENYVGYERTRELRVAVAAPSWTAAASMRPPRDWRSINGRWLASGRWAGRRPP